MDVSRISTGVNPPYDVNAVIEIPQGGSPVKYELDKDSGALFVDRFLHTAMFYPGNYGFIPNTLSDDGDPCDVLVIPMMEDRSFAMTAVARFRQSDIRTQFYAEQKKFTAKMSYADKLKVPFAVILGEDEAESNVYSVKNMRTGEQVKLAPEEAVAYVQQELEKMNQGRLILDD